MTNLTKQKKLNLLAFLISVLCIPTIYASQGKQEDKRKVKLVGKDKQKYTIKRKHVLQSGLIKDMLEEQDELEEEVPEIPITKVEREDLLDIIALMQESYEYKDDKDAKEKLAEFTKKEPKILEIYDKKGKKENIKRPKWNLDKLIDLLLIANYLNAPLILKALAYEIAKNKINKEILKKLIPEMLFEIQTQYIIRHKELPIGIFDDKIIKDLKKKSFIGKISRKESKYDTALRIMKGGKFVIIYYDDKDKIQLGDVKEGTVEIFKYVEKADIPYTIAISTRSEIILWNTTLDEVIKKFEANAGNIAFSPDGNYIAGSSTNNTVKIWNVNTGKLVKTFKGNKEGVSSIAFSPDGTQIASGSQDGTVKLWNVKTGNLEKTLDNKRWVTSVAFSPDGKLLASGTLDNTVNTWNVKTDKDVKTDKPVKTFGGDRESDEGGGIFMKITVNSVAFSPDGTHIASGEENNTVRLWNVNTGKLVKTFKGNYPLASLEDITSVAFNPDGEYIASGIKRFGKVLLWNVNTGTLEKTFEMYENVSGTVAFSPDGKYIASGGWAYAPCKKVVLWDIATGKPKSIYKFDPQSYEAARSIALRPM
ncbi:hypothetical protein ACFLYA_00325 [Candidatus Dependentiae bacterium]